MTVTKALTTLAATGLLGASTPPPAVPLARPSVDGISHLAVYTRDMAKAEDFYVRILGARKGADPEDARGVRFYFSPRQFVEVLPAPLGQGPDMLAHVAYTTADAAGLRAYLAAKGVTGLSSVRAGEHGERWFGTRDPEGNAVQFVQPARGSGAVLTAISGRIIHVGHVVRDRARQDSFYRGLLGFRPYWFGAFQPGKVDWVSQQMPDGRDWLEYMMVGPGSDVPLEKLDANQFGVLNHLSLGVRNMKVAYAKLSAANRISPRHDGPQMGRDGKWQTNFYDPDGTRVELMEFTAVAKPCCSPFTAQDPAP